MFISPKKLTNYSRNHLNISSNTERHKNSPKFINIQQKSIQIPKKEKSTFRSAEINNESIDNLSGIARQINTPSNNIFNILTDRQAFDGFETG